MSSRRIGKETASSSGGPPSKRQATPRNHDIEFNTLEQRSRYKSLLSKHFHPCRYQDSYSINKLGIRDNAYRLLSNLRWVEMLRPMKGFENFTYEFLSSITFTKDRLNFDNPDHRVSFWLMNIDYEMSLENFCLEMGIANAGFIHESWNHDRKPITLLPFRNVLLVKHNTIRVPIRLVTFTTLCLGTSKGQCLVQFGVGKRSEPLGWMNSLCFGKFLVRPREYLLLLALLSCFYRCKV